MALDLERRMNILERMSTPLPSSRPETTGLVTRGAARLLIGLGYAPVAEMSLPNGRRADLMALGPRGEFLIVEVKSCLEDYRCDEKWGDYAPYCDRFYFAVPPGFPREVIPEEPGLIVADGFDGAVARESPVALLAPARRKALILAFGRLAAMRAMGIAGGAITL
jgi:hypothetical protein